MTLADNENKKVVDDQEDPVDRMLKKTGCIELHYKVQVISSLRTSILA